MSEVPLYQLALRREVFRPFKCFSFLFVFLGGRGLNNTGVCQKIENTCLCRAGGRGDESCVDLWKAHRAKSIRELAKINLELSKKYSLIHGAHAAVRKRRSRCPGSRSRSTATFSSECRSSSSRRRRWRRRRRRNRGGCETTCFKKEEEQPEEDQV